MQQPERDKRGGLSSRPTPSRVGETAVWLRRAVPSVFLAVVAVAAGYELHKLDFHAIRATLHTLDLRALLGVQLVALAGMLAMGLYDWQAARALHLRLPVRTLVRNAWIANSFNNIVGLSGMAGSGIRLLLLTAEKVKPGPAMAFAALIMTSVPLGLAVLSWPLLPAALPVTGRLPVPEWLAPITLCVFALYLPVYVTVLHKGWLKSVAPSLGPMPWPALAALAMVSTLDWLLAAVTAWLALVISGADLHWTVFLTAYVLACTLGIASLVPGGLGVFDTALFLLLEPATDNPTGVVSGLLVYRACYFLTPWLIGLYLGAGRLAATRTVQRFALEKSWRVSRWLGILRPPLNLLASLGVRVLAYLTFFGGVVLLVSAAFPALVERLSLLHSVLPLAVIEISHLLSVATGVLLIALSRGIAEQARSAYRLTVFLLAAGISFSLMKGIDYEEALILGAIIILLRLERHRFYRDDYPLFSARTLRWLGGLVVAVIGFAWLGDWVHGSIPLGWEHLSHFAAHAEAPRFARSLLVAAMVALMFLAWTLFRRSSVDLPCAVAAELDEAQAVLARHGGNSFAHLVFLGDKRLFWSTGRDAFIQYGLVRDRLVALGDPCGNAAVFETLVNDFREYADRHNMTPCFYEVDEAGLHRYHDAGFAFLKLGEAALVDVRAFTLEGKRNESLRHAVNRARREGAVFQWLHHPLPEATWQELQTISDQWLATRHAAEKGFSLGAFRRDYLVRSDIAVVSLNQRIVAFANLMPDYASHHELSVDLMRHREDAPPGSMEFLFVHLIEYARSAQYRFFNLGIAPLSGVGDSRYARTGEKVARYVYEYGNRLYNYRGLRGFKQKFRPRWRSTYLAYPVLSPLPALLMDIAALIAGGYRYIFFRRR
jgi:phosphatidylglycerol lysyltransferase